MGFSIDGRKIGTDASPFLIAELSGNHEQSLEKALKLVDVAAEAGVDAVKLQTYTADTMTLNLSEGEFFIDDPQSLWRGHSLYELYEKAHTPWDWHRKIMDRCKERGLLCFSTPFDATAVDFLEGLGVPAYKVASFENTDHDLIRRVAQTGKPMIISTGMATMVEIAEAVQVAREAGCKDLALLKCTSSYPADPAESNLKAIPLLRGLFRCEVGLSDHTLGIGVSIASVALGATIIEKHFNLSREDGAVDGAFSLEPAELKLLVTEKNRAWAALGEAKIEPAASELGSRRLCRSLYVTENLKAGALLNRKNLRAIRPGSGLPVKYFTHFLGKKLGKDVRRGTPLSWDLLE